MTVCDSFEKLSNDSFKLSKLSNLTVLGKNLTVLGRKILVSKTVKFFPKTVKFDSLTVLKLSNLTVFSKKWQLTVTMRFDGGGEPL